MDASEARRRRSPGIDLRGVCSREFLKTCELTITNEDTGEQLYHCSWATDYTLDEEWVVEAVASGRSRWKVENEGLNVLKNQGYNLEHNYGHGQRYLSMVVFDPLDAGLSLPQCFGPQLLDLPNGTPRTGSPTYLLQRLESADPLPLRFQLAPIAHLYVSTARLGPRAWLGSIPCPRRRLTLPSCGWLAFRPAASWKFRYQRLPISSFTDSAKELDVPNPPLEQKSTLFRRRCATRYSLLRLPLDHSQNCWSGSFDKGTGTTKTRPTAPSSPWPTRSTSLPSGSLNRTRSSAQWQRRSGSTRV